MPTDQASVKRGLHIVTVVTRNQHNPDAAPEVKNINFYNPSDRKWLATHCWWAMHNHRSVTTYHQEL
jgi:hypothetical protein